MDKQYGVWIKQSYGWELLGYMSQDIAIRTHNEYKSEGVPCRVHPRHKNTQRDLIDG